MLRNEDDAEAKAKKLSQQEVDEQEESVKVQGLDKDKQETRAREHQVKRPWHRDDADAPPVKEPGDEKAPLKKGTISLFHCIPRSRPNHWC